MRGHRPTARVSSRLCSIAACALFLFSSIPASAEPSARIPTGRAGHSTMTQERQRIPRQESHLRAAIQGQVREPEGRGIGGVSVTLRDLATGREVTRQTDAEGVFRFADLAAGRYELKFEKKGYASPYRREVEIGAGALHVAEISLEPLDIAKEPAPRLPQNPQLGPPLPPPAPLPLPAIDARRRPSDVPQADATPVPLPPPESVFTPQPNRWELEMPAWDRYNKGGEYPYVKGRWWDPFNLNRYKGDKPIIGNRTFLNLTATSDTLYELRRTPAPSNVSSEHPGSTEFFGRGEQSFFTENFRFAADLFYGDTAFRPFDFRVRITPAVNVNYLVARELGIVNIDVSKGTRRLDAHAGLQEAFVEFKLRDLSVNYDFLSVRAGIQGFSSDFRGFLFVDEQPGVRLFGNLFNNRWQYNLAYFHMLEKDTNSLLNTFERRHQQVLVANLYVQDFFVKGYDTQFSVHFNKDDATIHFDKNNFLVRPAPIGLVVGGGTPLPHNIRAAYLGWTGSGHFGRINISHAFYQAVGHDDLNPLAGRRVTINAQMAAAEVSYDKDWIRFKGSLFYASGDADPRDDRARGFDSIVDFPVFAGGPFSLWNRQGIRLTGSGVQLVSPNSLLPSLRSNKEEGQANFVNPGIWLFNLGADIEVTPKLRSLINVNYLRFDRTESLELLLFQSGIRHPIGWDTSIGFQYRPPLSDNIVFTGGAAALFPEGGFRDIYTGKTLLSLFGNVRLQF